jgi:dTMP kinase
MVALEGVDGSGKSGVAAFLARRLQAAGYDIVATQEPGGTEEGAALRRLLLGKETYDWVPVAELLLMNASRRQHVERVIKPAIEASKIVICDRFVGSSIAYQGAGRGLPFEMIRQLHHLAIDDFWPDLTLVLDLDPVVGLRRSRQRLEESEIDEGRFEALETEFHSRVRCSYLNQAAEFRETYRIIDAENPPEAVQQEALDHVLELLARRS